MTIRLYNSRTRQKEPFAPLDPSNVRMYVCGPTVYDRAHIGNARPVVVFDVLFRLLRHVYGSEHVTYVRNFTDVDDKIIARAQETLRRGESLEAACRRITDETIGWYHDDMDALGALRPTHEPRCTEYIPAMVDMTAELIRRGNAYEAEGHVLFDVGKWPRYGELSGRSTDDMIAGARVEVAPYKRSPMDFVLWKPSTPEQPGWESPWGRGRPGWHIECSAMAGALLGEVFDIHGGGIDLQFPHHENELAQSCCANHTEVMANFWMHNGFLQVEGEKMSKSLGNFLYLKDVGVEAFDATGKSRPVPDTLPDGWVLRSASRYALRLFFLMTHYRKPMNWTADGLREAQARLDRLRSAAWKSRSAERSEVDPRVMEAIGDDLNTPLALAMLDKLIEERQWASLSASMDFLGIYQFDFLATDFVDEANIKDAKRRHFTDSDTVREHARPTIEALLANRLAARKARDFACADAIRDGLIAAGVVVMDRPNAPTDWELTPDFDPAKLEALQ